MGEFNLYTLAVVVILVATGIAGNYLAARRNGKAFGDGAQVTAEELRLLREELKLFRLEILEEFREIKTQLLNVRRSVRSGVDYK